MGSRNQSRADPPICVVTCGYRHSSGVAQIRSWISSSGEKQPNWRTRWRAQPALTAVARRWTRVEFRQKRATLGRMAAEYLRHARRLAGLPDIDLPSIWAWDDGDIANKL